MKKIIVFTILLLVFTYAVSAEAKDSWWGSYYMPGNLSFEGSIGYEGGSLSGGGSITAVTLIPEAEIILFKPYFGGVSPLDFGAAVRGHIGFGFSDYTLDSNLSAGLGILGTFHFGFRGIGSHFTNYNDSPSALFSQLSKFDYFAEAGIVIDLLSYDDSSMIGFAGATGFNYYLNENLAFTLTGTIWNGMYGGSIGATYKIGPSQNVRELDLKFETVSIDMDPLYMQIYLSQFYSIYWYSFYAGGFYFDDSNYKEGQGTEWKLSSSDDNDELIISKALLIVNDDASRWWKIKYAGGSDEIVYEFLIDGDYNILKLRFVDADSGEVREYNATPEELESYSTADMREISGSDYKDWDKGSVSLKTAAGKFETSHLLFEESAADYTYEWWISDSVPGRMVKFIWKSSKESMMGELTKISKGNKSELNSF